MNIIKNILRFLTIIRIFLKYNILNILIKKSKNKKFSKKLRFMFEELGPIFIKTGQVLSTRTEIFEDYILNELKKLQTNVKQINFLKIKKEFYNEYENIFKKFNQNPIHSASVAQIHTAILNDNTKVIVKIIKPDIENLIKYDINIIKFIFFFLSYFFKKFERLNLIELISDIEKTFKNEIDLKNEAVNAIKIRNNFKKFNYIYIPKIFLELSKKNVLVLEYMEGINILNKKKLNLNNLNYEIISKNLLENFFYQIFKNRIFHADLHPGNILISKDKFKNPIILLFDFGITGQLSKNESIYLIQNIISFIKKDYKKIALLHLNSKTISNINSLNFIENEIFYTFEPILEKNLNDISFKNTIKSILELNEKIGTKLQPNFILFQKTILNIENLCRKIFPNINIWKETKIFFSKNILDVNFFKKNSKSNKNIKNNIIIKSNIKKYFYLLKYLLILLLIIILFYINKILD